MPLLYTEHSKKPQLEEELRNLYRVVNRLAAGVGTATPPAVFTGDDGDQEVGTVYSWHLRADFHFTPNQWPDDGTEYIFDLPIPQIKKPYTHLDLNFAVLQAVGVNAWFEWVIRGNERFYLWDRYDPELPGQGHWSFETGTAHHYWLDGLPGQPNHVPFTIGRYAIEPNYDDLIMADGDLAFTPIYPARLADSSYAWEKLKAVAKLRYTGSVNQGLCYKVWLVGRYMLRDDSEPEAHTCFYGT